MYTQRDIRTYDDDDDDDDDDDHDGDDIMTQLDGPHRTHR